MITSEFCKSSYSDHLEECVEVAINHPHTIAIRDSKRPTSPILHLSSIAWSDFRKAVTSGWFKH